MKFVKFFAGIGASLKESLRRMVVGLKRKPSIIPLLMLLVAFMVYSMNLRLFSDTTSVVNGRHMGLSEFVIMLLGMLIMVCLMNAFPHRKKANIPMLVVFFVMAGAIIFCDFYYRNQIAIAATRAVNQISIVGENAYIMKAYNLLMVHAILMIISVVLVVLLPVYSKLLRMIKTSVNVEDNGAMEAIEITE